VTQSWDDELLDALREEGDPRADGVVASYFADLGLDEPGRLVRLLVHHGELPAEEQNPAVAAYLAEHPGLPEWADPELITQACDFFAEHGPHIVSILYSASLPTAYAAAKGVQVLHLTARLATDTKRRITETAQFIVDVMAPAGLQPCGRGYRDARFVRLMHAAVRWLILHDPNLPKTSGRPATGLYWDQDWGVPINQEDLLATLLTFTEVVFEALDRSGVHCSDSEASAYLHAWSVVGYLLGIRPELLPLDRDDSRTLMAATRRRQHQPSAAGWEMTAALLENASTGMPAGLKGLPASSVRFYVGDATADLLAVPTADWTRRLFEPLSVLARLNSFELAHDRLRAAVARRMGRSLLRLAVRSDRGGGRPAFQIPTHLADRWGIS
jgi:hypothetical protein